MMALHNISFSNSTDAPLIFPTVKTFTVVDVLGLIMLTILVLCIIGGNILVIMAFITVGRKIRTVTNYFVVSLAVSDILVGIFSVPFWMWVQIKHQKIANTFHLVFAALDIFCGVASILNLTVISLERLFAVVRPASHRNLSGHIRPILIAIASIWVFALINSGLYFVKSSYNWNGYTIYIVLVGFVIPALIIVGSYIGIFNVAQKHVTQQRRIKQEMRLAGMIAIVIALFIACWFPFFLLNILFNYCKPPICDAVIMRKSIPFVKFLHYSNSMMNPLIYAYRNSDYREAFKHLLFSLLKHRNYGRQRSSSNKSTYTMRTDEESSHRSVRLDSTVSWSSNNEFPSGAR